MPSLDRIGEVEVDVVLFAKGDSHAPLGVKRVAILRAAFGDHGDFSMSAQFQGGAQASHSGPNNEKVSRKNFSVHECPVRRRSHIMQDV
jgi:hypothetical protein